MENPAKELANVVSLVTAAMNPEIQKVAVLKYYAPDAGFSHPICRVSPGPGARQAILGILQWYRIMSPVLKIDVRGITYDAEKREAFIDAVQVFHIRYSLLAPAPSRLLVHLTLKPSADDPNALQIAQHEDFYHPDDFAALVVPPLIPLIRLGLWLGTVLSLLGAWVFQTFFGFWRVQEGEGGKGVQLVEPQTNGAVAGNGTAGKNK